MDFSDPKVCREAADFIMTVPEKQFTLGLRTVGQLPGKASAIAHLRTQAGFIDCRTSSMWYMRTHPDLFGRRDASLRWDQEVGTDSLSDKQLAAYRLYRASGLTERGSMRKVLA